MGIGSDFNKGCSKGCSKGCFSNTGVGGLDKVGVSLPSVVLNLKPQQELYFICVNIATTKAEEADIIAIKLTGSI